MNILERRRYKIMGKEQKWIIYMEILSLQCWNSFNELDEFDLNMELKNI